MLLNHTAGYPDVYSSREVGRLFGRNHDPDRKWTFEQLLPGIKPGLEAPHLRIHFDEREGRIEISAIVSERIGLNSALVLVSLRARVPR